MRKIVHTLVHILQARGSCASLLTRSTWGVDLEAWPGEGRAPKKHGIKVISSPTRFERASVMLLMMKAAKPIYSIHRL